MKVALSATPYCLLLSNLMKIQWGDTYLYLGRISLWHVFRMWGYQAISAASNKLGIGGIEQARPISAPSPPLAWQDPQAWTRHWSRGSRPPCSSPPAQGSSCQSCWPRSSCQLHHASIEPQVRHRHLVLGEGKGSHANAHSLAPQPVTAVDSLVPLPVKSFKHILQYPGAPTENSVEPFKPLQICMTSMLSKHNCPKCEVCPFPSCGLDPNFHLSWVCFTINPLHSTSLLLNCFYPISFFTLPCFKRRPETYRFIRASRKINKLRF